MTTSPDPKRLAESPLFGAIDQEGLSLFVAAAKPVVLAAGEEVFAEGSNADSLYLVDVGQLEVFKRVTASGASAGQSEGSVQEKLLASLGPDDFFGEMGLIDMQPRPATVRAQTETKLWRWDRLALRQIQSASLKAYTLLIMNIARELSRRLRRADAIIVSRT